MSESVCLVGYGLLVAVVGPVALVRFGRNGWVPRLGVLLWLLAVVSVLAAWFGAALVLMHETIAEVRVGLVAVLVAGVARTGWVGVTSLRRAHRRRARHRDGLTLVGHADADLGALIVEAPRPMAYCLPGRDGLVVVTTAARNALTRPELSAVLAHERAHLAGRHHVVLLLGQVLARVLPFLPLFAQLERHLPLLLEMCADDDAARSFGRGTVARAIAAMTSAPAPAGTFGMGGESMLLRARRLDRPIPRWRRRLTAIVGVMVIVLLSAGPYLVTIDPLCAHHD